MNIVFRLSSSLVANLPERCDHVYGLDVVCGIEELSERTAHDQFFDFELAPPGWMGKVPSHLDLKTRQSGNAPGMGVILSLPRSILRFFTSEALHVDLMTRDTL